MAVGRVASAVCVLAMTAPACGVPWSDGSAGRFTDVSDGAGLLGFTKVSEPGFVPGPGVAVADLDGDGLPEMVIGLEGNGTRLFWNLGDFAFEERTGGSGIDERVPTTTPLFADFDGDGDSDLVLGATGPDRLYENVGARFRDVTGEAGLPSGWTRVAVPADFDGDGRLDLFLSVGVEPDALANHMLFRNAGNLRFEDVSESSGVASTSVSHAASVVDYDTDGDVDLLVTSDFRILDASGGDLLGGAGRDLLFRNDGTGPGDFAFVDVTEAAGLDEPRASMGAAIADFDGDGRPDVYVTDFGENALLLQAQPGRFSDRAAELGAGVARRSDDGCGPTSPAPRCALVSWGVEIDDLDHDGALDLLVVNGQVPPWDADPQPTAMLAQVGGGFEAVESGVGSVHGRGLVSADLDLDGDLDLVIAAAGGGVRVYRNDAGDGGGNWLDVALAGTRGNTAGIGAVVRVYTTGGAVHTRYVGTGGGMRTAGPVRAHFGLGDDAVADVRVTWPGGASRSYGALEINRAVTLVEGATLE